MFDVGAGEGSVTRGLLELGAHVTAVDVSESQLAELSRKCEPVGVRLQTHCREVGEVLERLEGPFDVVVASACPHHLPDYLGVIREAVRARQILGARRTGNHNGVIQSMTPAFAENAFPTASAARCIANW